MGLSRRRTNRQKVGAQLDHRPKATSITAKVIHRPTAVAAARS